jgi:hypothetical protein
MLVESRARIETEDSSSCFSEEKCREYVTPSTHTTNDDDDDEDINIVTKLARACEEFYHNNHSRNISNNNDDDDDFDVCGDDLNKLKVLMELISVREVGLTSLLDENDSGRENEDDESGRGNSSSSSSSSASDQFRKEPNLKNFFKRVMKDVSTTAAATDARLSSEFHDEMRRNSIDVQADAQENVDDDESLVYSQRIISDERFHICTFLIPAGQEIPLHNHPGMTVLSKCLYGACRVLKYKWSDGEYRVSSAKTARECELISDSILLSKDGEIDICTPKENIHRIMAITDVAILDVFVPPYNIEGGRDCTYYDLKSSVIDDDDDNCVITTLIELGEEEESLFECHSMEYKGMKVQPRRKQQNPPGIR